MAEVILCDRSDIIEVIDDARMDWINDVFDSLEIPDEVFDVDDIRDYRMNMEDLGIEVILHSNGDVDIFKKSWYETEIDAGWLPPEDEHLVGQWKSPERVLRAEKNKDIYYEVHINAWSIADMEI